MSSEIRDSAHNEMNMTSQLEAWTGGFGNEYVDRNDYGAWKVDLGVRAFGRILGGLDITSVLEVGSNIGLNLLSINELFKGGVKLYAVEPNRKAFDRLNSQSLMRLEKAWNCNAFRLPLDNSLIDLVFTSGVLIHISPKDLGSATDEIVRVARRFILCIEYFSHTPVELPYRSEAGLLFKRDFGAFYLDRFPQLKTISYGFLWQREFPIFDNLNWWLFEKGSGATGVL